ncbi:MAG: stage III sporulation protein AG [Oscillospiraceae bacterium]|nr:stage III sporulation protein AG [Oscillospiraceae bacterium]
MKDKPSFLQDVRLKKPLQFLSKYKYMLLVMLVGAFLLMMPSGNKQTKKTAEEENTGISFSLEDQEKKMETALSKIDGAGEVRLLLTLKTGVENQFATDSNNTEQTDTSGGMNSAKQKTTVILSRGSGMQEAVLSSQTYPLYQGALVVCEGGGDASVKLEMTKALSSLTGLGADKITVVKMSSNSSAEN